MMKQLSFFRILFVLTVADSSVGFVLPQRLSLHSHAPSLRMILQDDGCLSPFHSMGTWIVANNAWSNPASDRLKSMVGATLWGIPIAIFLLLALIAATFSVVMPVVDNMFFSTLQEDLQAYLPELWEEYEQDGRLKEGETLSTRRDLQLELYDRLQEYKAEALREMCLGENSSAYYKSLWSSVNSQLEEGEELEYRPDLIAMLEEGMLKQTKGMVSSDFATTEDMSDSDSNPLDKIVDSELNRVDLMMRFFDKSLEFSGKSRRAIYKDWEKRKAEMNKSPETMQSSDAN
mmetsp:Transcript_27311/g.45180  ORF Transcript_27311/g.45180 Transcript_27311/m.45180 type:complete len:289 (-) Transcript_27311:555-1421(-)